MVLPARLVQRARHAKVTIPSTFDQLTPEHFDQDQEFEPTLVSETTVLETFDSHNGKGVSSF